MKFLKTKIKGLFVIEPSVFDDDRGYFFESYNESVFREKLGDIDFVQDNESESKYGVLRGLHYQEFPFSQSKLTRVVSGEILDVVVDLRENSPTFGEHFSVVLSGENKKQLFIPKGFAHGFVTLSKEAIVNYKVDGFYNKNSESGIIYNDKTLNIDWILSPDKFIISEKDLLLPSFKNL